MRKDGLELLRSTKDRHGNVYRGKRRGGRSEEHEKMIERLCLERGATRSSFGKELAVVLPDELEELTAWKHKHPDCFRFDSKTQVLTIFEVVKTHDCNPETYLELWWILDCNEWDLVLEIWSHHGGRSGIYGNSEFCSMWYQKQ